MGFAYAEDGLMLYKFLVPLSKRRVGLDNDPIFPTALNGVPLNIHGVQLELVNSWLVLRDVHDVFNVNTEKVRYS